MQEYRLTVEYKDGTSFSSPDFAYVINLANDNIDKLLQLVLVKGEKQYPIDVTALPKGARLIHYVQRRLVVTEEQVGDKVYTTEKNEFGTTGFGYQYNDSSGRSHKVIKEIP